MLPVIWLPEADAELKEALLRYENVRPELALRFAEAVVDTVERISSGAFALPGNRERTATGRSPPVSVWSFLHSGRDADRHRRLFSWTARPEPLGSAVKDRSYEFDVFGAHDVVGGEEAVGEGVLRDAGFGFGERGPEEA